MTVLLVEDVGDGTEQLDGAVDLGRAVPLDRSITGLVGKPLTGQPVSEVIGEPLRVKQIVRRLRERAASKASNMDNCWPAYADESTSNAICASACAPLEPRTAYRAPS